MRRSAPQQQVGEAARRRPRVEHPPARRVVPERVQRARQLVRPARDVRLPRAARRRAAASPGSTAVAGLVATWPPTRTSPSAISAVACSRLRARPRRTSSASSRARRASAYSCSRRPRASSSSRCTSSYVAACSATGCSPSALEPLRDDVRDVRHRTVPAGAGGAGSCSPGGRRHPDGPGHVGAERRRRRPVATDRRGGRLPGRASSRQVRRLGGPPRPSGPRPCPQLEHLGRAFFAAPSGAADVFFAAAAFFGGARDAAFAAGRLLRGGPCSPSQAPSRRALAGALAGAFGRRALPVGRLRAFAGALAALRAPAPSPGPAQPSPGPACTGRRVAGSLRRSLAAGTFFAGAGRRRQPSPPEPPSRRPWPPGPARPRSLRRRRRPGTSVAGGSARRRPATSAAGAASCSARAVADLRRRLGGPALRRYALAAGTAFSAVAEPCRRPSASRAPAWSGALPRRGLLRRSVAAAACLAGPACPAAGAAGAASTGGTTAGGAGPGRRQRGPAADGARAVCVPEVAQLALEQPDPGGQLADLVGGGEARRGRAPGRPRTARARVIASRLALLCATRSSASAVTCSAVASPCATSARAAASAFCRRDVGQAGGQREVCLQRVAHVVLLGHPPGCGSGPYRLPGTVVAGDAPDAAGPAVADAGSGPRRCGWRRAQDVEDAVHALVDRSSPRSTLTSGAATATTARSRASVSDLGVVWSGRLGDAGPAGRDRRPAPTGPQVRLSVQQRRPGRARRGPPRAPRPPGPRRLRVQAGPMDLLLLRTLL